MDAGITLGEFMQKIKLGAKATSGTTLGEFVDRIKQQKAQLAGSLGDFEGRIKQGSVKKNKVWTSPSTSVSANKNSPACVMCEFAMATLEKQFITNKTAVNPNDQIKPV